MVRTDRSTDRAGRINPDTAGWFQFQGAGDERQLFNQFMSSLKKQPFESDRNALLDNALISSYFTTDQCIRLLEFYTFDSEKKPFLKKIYPRIADKANFFRALDKLTFSSDKEEVNQFIKVYHENNN